MKAATLSKIASVLLVAAAAMGSSRPADPYPTNYTLMYRVANYLLDGPPMWYVCDNVQKVVNTPVSSCHMTTPPDVTGQFTCDHQSTYNDNSADFSGAASCHATVQEQPQAICSITYTQTTQTVRGTVCYTRPAPCWYSSSCTSADYRVP